jgi:hypothetical protein
MLLDWSRAPQDEVESNLCQVCSGSALDSLRSMHDGSGLPLHPSPEDAERLLKVQTPLILSALDAYHSGHALDAVRNELSQDFLAEYDADWNYLTTAIMSLDDVDVISVSPEFSNGEIIAFNFLASDLILDFISRRESSGLDYSRPLDVHTWSDHPEVNAFVDGIYAEHFSGGSKRIRKKHLKVILLDLYVAWREDPGLKIAFNRNRNSYSARSRYNSLHISALSIEVVDKLIEVGLLEQHLGFYDRRSGGGSRVSRIWPTETLINFFAEARFGPFDIGHHSDRECIILRAQDPETRSSRDIEYEDTEETNRMRGVLEKYTDLLSTTFIDIPGVEENWFNPDPFDSEDTNRVFISQKDKFVRRVFNRGSFEKGGRFFGGWWQRCPKDWRSAIFMDDFPVSEIDYSGLHIVLLYALAGINYWEAIGDDPYTISKPDFIATDELSRDVCKSLVLMALNARDEAAAFSAFRSDAKTGSLEKRYTNNQLKIVLDALREKHSLIADKFASDAGIDLMNIDGRITEIIIEIYTEQSIPVLTIHDSYLVPDGYESDLEETMKSAFEEVTGIANVQMKEETHHPEAWEPLSLDDGGSHWHEAMEARHNPPRSERYGYQWAKFKEHFNSPAVPFWVQDNEFQ